MTNQQLLTVPQELVAQNKSQGVHHDWQRLLRSGPSLPFLFILQRLPVIPRPPRMSPDSLSISLLSCATCRQLHSLLRWASARTSSTRVFPNHFLSFCLRRSGEDGFLPMSRYSPVQLIYLYIVYRCVHSSSFFSKLIRKFYHSALVCPKTQEPSGHWLQEEEKNTMAGRLALSSSTLARSVAGIGSVLAFPLEDREKA